MKLHIIYTESAMLLSKQSELTWRELQTALVDFKASLGPWNYDEVVEYLADEYKNLEPAANIQVVSFLQSQESTQEFTFCE